MIANILSLNETTKKYRVTFNSGDENSVNWLISFQEILQGKKRKTIEGLKIYKPWGKARRV